MAGERMPKRVHVIVRGRVQNVGYRYFVIRRARALGLTGWVTNLDDPRAVELEAEGADQEIEQLIAALRQGPPGARVSEIAVTAIDLSERRESGFQIR